MDQPPPSRPRAPYRYFGCFRAVLATLVMIQHAGALVPTPAAAVLQPHEVGSMAVFGFFVLSGFVITEAVDVFYRGRPWAFLVNRFLRLGPTYLAALLLTAVGLAFLAGSFVPAADESPITPDLYAFRTVALNILALFPVWRVLEGHLHVPEVLEQGWALRIEVLFYLATAAALFVAATLRMTLGAVLSAIGVLGLLAITLLGSRTAGSALENVPYFVLGVGFYYVVARRERMLAGAFCLSASAFAAVELLARAPSFGPANLPRDRVGELALLAGLVVIFMLLALLPDRRGALARSVARLDRLCGEITYPLYLMHGVVMVAAKTLLPHGRWASVILAFTVAFALAGLTVVLVERPVARLRTLVRRREASSDEIGAATPHLLTP